MIARSVFAAYRMAMGMVMVATILPAAAPTR
jgi:hypothetical protein